MRHGLAAGQCVATNLADMRGSICIWFHNLWFHLFVATEYGAPTRRVQMVYRLLTEAAAGQSVDDDADDMTLNRATMTKVIRLLRELKSHPSAWAFLEPVAVAKVPGYTDVITTPMDLQTVQEKLDSDQVRLCRF